jgi:sulfite exporter TauE/SafE
MEAFMLGISTGGICIAYCAPVLVPYLLGEGKSIIQNFLLLGQFLSGRLLGYLFFGVFAWALDEAVLRQSNYGELLIGASYVFFSALLIFYGFFKTRKTIASCTKNPALGQTNKIAARWPALLPLIGGLITGLSFCPPFYLTLTAAAVKGSLLQSMFFFFQFFLGTAIFFIPIPFTGIFRRYSMMKFIGKTTAALIGVYYLYTGTIMLIEGVGKI